jgi:bifunctional non-homologous end joining protein LigD
VPCVILPPMARPSKVPKPLQPMLATLINAPFDDPAWVFETKWDGFRLVALIENRSVTLFSRSGLIVSDNYMPIAKALEKLRKDAVIDGELVALDERGVSRFQLLQNALRAAANLHYCVFDIMFLDGKDLRSLPMDERKQRLSPVLPKDPLLIYSEHWPEHGKRLFKEAQKHSLEGIMAKRAQSRYLSGARSKDWLKIKTGKRQEVVIVGFTAPQRSRPRFGALVLAVRDKGGWRYVGHVGTGFSHATLEALYDRMLPLQTPSSPFKGRVKDQAATTWIKPKLVAEVKFTEWTTAGEMRHPAFLGLREDKKPMDVVLEKEARRPT